MQDPHPLSRQEKVDAGDVVLVKTVVDYCFLHKLSLNKNFATKAWADISVITRKACEVRGLLDSEAKRQFTEAQCKALWHKFTQSFRHQDDETRKQLANLGGKCKNMKQEMYDLMAPVMANDSATAPLCLVSGGVDTGVYKRGRGRVDSCDEDEEEDEDVEIIEARLHAEARKHHVSPCARAQGYNEVPGEQRLKSKRKIKKGGEDSNAELTRAMHKSTEALEKSANISSLTRLITTSHHHITLHLVITGLNTKRKRHHCIPDVPAFLQYSCCSSPGCMKAHGVVSLSSKQPLGIPGHTTRLSCRCPSDDADVMQQEASHDDIGRQVDISANAVVQATEPRLHLPKCPLNDITCGPMLEIEGEFGLVAPCLTRLECW
ncbi:hypothetical protein V8C86DRAFT_3185118 [Haematococcus lacustris]